MARQGIGLSDENIIENLPRKIPDPPPSGIRRMTKTVRRINSVNERLRIYLETVDVCDVVFHDKEGDKLIFMVTARDDAHLPLIAAAIASERGLLAELGAGQVDHRDGYIRLDVSVACPQAD